MSNADDCFYFDKSNCHNIGLARAIAGLVVVVTGLVALIIILVLRAFKKYSQRLFLYLTIATLLHAPIYIMEVLAVNCHHNPYPTAREPLCTITGTFDMYSSWLQNLIVLWITGYLFRVVVLRKFIKTKIIEIVVIVLFLIVPLSTALIPLIKREYGVSGAWCWISAFKSGSCKKIDYFGLGYQLGLWYLPFLLETIAVFITVICIARVFIKKAYTYDEIFRDEFKMQMKESLPLLIFPVVYCILNTFEITLDLIAIKFTDIYWLWSIDAVINPTKAILVIVGYLVSIMWIKQKAWRKRRRRGSSENPYEEVPPAKNTYGSISSPPNSLSQHETTFSDTENPG